MKTLNLITFVLLLLSFTSLSAQQEATTNDGKKVILNDDKTWNYYEPEQQLDDKSADQDCSKYIISEKDEMTGKTYISSSETIILSDDEGVTGIGVTCILSNKTVIVIFQAIGASNCIDKDDEINILFRDDTRITLGNDSKFNCERKSTVYLGSAHGRKDDLRQLMEKEIKSVRVWTSDGYVQSSFTKDDSVRFMRSLVCFSNHR